MRKDSLFIVGTIPPPIGGVTIHTMRLIEMLGNSNISIEFVDIRPKKKEKFNILVYIKNFIYIFTSMKKGCLHYQLNNWIEAALLSFCCKLFDFKMVYTVHSFTFKLNNLGILKRSAIRFCEKNITKFIAPSETIKQQLINNSFSQDKIIVLNTFLPPTNIELTQKTPKEIKKFINTSEKVIVANAYKLYLNNDGIDVYGLDMCIQACAKIPRVKFLFCSPIIGDQGYYQKCLADIKRLGIGNRFLIYNNDVSLVSLFKYCDLFVRPTVSDSYGISIAEALTCGVPAIASDVCDRAEGTVLFKSRNLDDFVMKIKCCLEDGEEYHFNNQSLISEYLKLYSD